MAISLNIKLTDTKDVEKLADDLASLIPAIRDRRKQQVEQWLLNHTAWRAKDARSFFRSEIFNHYVPAFRRAVEKFVVRGAQMLMPNNEFFEVFPADELNDKTGKKAEGVMAYLLHLMRK